jgi:hypothetical protein
MSQTQFYDEMLVTKRSARRGPIAAKSATRGRKRAPALVRVPMLDWPSDLFGDNVNATELAREDYSMRWELSDESYFQAAA